MAANHGRTKFCLSVNRLNNDLGYADDNVELLTVSENARKRYVPYFKNLEQEKAAIAEAEKAVIEAYPELERICV